MGKNYSKNEDKEILITQNAAAGSNTGGITEIESNIKTSNILITVALIIFICTMVYLAWKSWRNKERKWIEKRMQSEFFTRIRQRFSGRFNPTNADGGDTV